MDKGYLILQNGLVLTGERFGAAGDAAAELVFTTGMTGYLETLKKNMTVNTISPENRAKFVAKVKPVWDFYVKDGTFTDAEIQSLIKAGK